MLLRAFRSSVAVLLAAIFLGGTAAGVRAAENLRFKATAYAQSHDGDNCLVELRLRYRQDICELHSLINAAASPAEPPPGPALAVSHPSIILPLRPQAILRLRGPPAA